MELPLSPPCGVRQDSIALPLLLCDNVPTELPTRAAHPSLSIGIFYWGSIMQA